MTAPWVQTLVAVAILAGAALYLARRAWRRFARKPQPGHCGPDCGCGH